MIYPIDMKDSLPRLEGYESPRITFFSEILGCLQQIPAALVLIPMFCVLIVFILGRMLLLKSRMNRVNISSSQSMMKPQLG